MSIAGKDLVILHNINGVGHGRRGPFNDAPPKYQVVFEFNHRHLNRVEWQHTRRVLDGVFAACTLMPSNHWQVEVAQAYAAKRLRPPRVGDVVILSGKAWRVEPKGWSEHEGPLP